MVERSELCSQKRQGVQRNGQDTNRLLIREGSYQYERDKALTNMLKRKLKKIEHGETVFGIQEIQARNEAKHHKASKERACKNKVLIGFKKRCLWQLSPDQQSAFGKLTNLMNFVFYDGGSFPLKACQFSKNRVLLAGSCRCLGGVALLFRS